MAVLATWRVHAADGWRLGSITRHVTGFMGGRLFLLHLRPGRAQPRLLQLEATKWHFFACKLLPVC